MYVPRFCDTHTQCYAVDMRPSSAAIGNRRVYWAAEPESRRAAARAIEHWAWGQGQMWRSGRMSRALSLVSAYYGRGVKGDSTSSDLELGGDAGETTIAHVNGIAPLITNVVGLIAGRRPAVKPVATNGDATSTAQTRLAAQLHEYYDRRDGAPELELDAVRGGVLATSWWVVQSWLRQAGDVYALGPNGQPRYEGDLLMLTLPPWCVAADPVAHNVDARRWVVFRQRANRWDLAARAGDPYVREKLERGATLAPAGLSQWLPQGAVSRYNDMDALLGQDMPDEDAVTVWEVRHLPTPALPKGRLMQFVDDDCILFDSAAVGVDGGLVVDETTGEESYTPPSEVRDVGYPYAKRELHAYEYAPERVVGSSNGHSASVNLLGLQRVMDICTTSIATGIDRLGMALLWGGPSGEPQKPLDLGRGVQLLDTPNRPEVVDLPAVKPEMVSVFDFAQSQSRQTVALNDTVMGAPPKGMPASAQALQRAQAVQYHQVSQAEYVRLVERVSNGRLVMLKRFAKSKRIAEIAGRDGAYEVLEWSAEDIEGVERFRVEPVDPMSTSFEARQATAEFLAGKGLLSPEGFLGFLQTGNLEAELRPQTAWKELVERNKALLQQGVGLPPTDVAQSMATGEPVFVEDGQVHVRPLKSDPHHVAIPAYLSVANDPNIRSRNPDVVEAALSVVQESMRLWVACTPDECRAFGLPLLPSHEMAMAMPPMPLDAPVDGASPEEGVTETGLPEESPALPEPPVDPLTGEQDTTESLGGLDA